MKLIEITSLGCMSCIVMNDRIANFAKKHDFDLIVINSDLEDTSKYGKMDLFPLIILYDNHNTELKRIQGEFRIKDLEKELLETDHA